ncbi:hypothetical protein I4F81_000686 [Pyropia yezoensis]|uniref:Uncharacterized protein n=1 Tax=Pyropia yezoensis TaxID=2788 RepID=A0ACC3BKQ1_PYRYE|nr:hypothetical protein I4F81_000686 [Neopyropia yezoensis]
MWSRAGGAGVAAAAAAADAAAADAAAAAADAASAAAAEAAVMAAATARVAAWLASPADAPMERIPTSFSDLSSEALGSEVNDVDDAAAAAAASATATADPADADTAPAAPAPAAGAPTTIPSLDMQDTADAGGRVRSAAVATTLPMPTAVEGPGLSAAPHTGHPPPLGGRCPSSPERSALTERDCRWRRRESVGGRRSGS